MRLIDPKARIHAGHYIFQCALATLCLVLALLFMDALTHTALIATLGATAFIVFALPNSDAARARPLLGGYFIGIASGAACSRLAALPGVVSLLGGRDAAVVPFAAVAAGLAIFLMTATNSEHPPAGGIALGLVVNEWDLMTLVYVVGAAALFVAVRRLSRGRLIDLRWRPSGAGADVSLHEPAAPLAAPPADEGAEARQESALRPMRGAGAARPS
jgi:CBS-domain-containing membrane protein